jgi:signal transduction histidine kinase
MREHRHAGESARPGADGPGADTAGTAAGGIVDDAAAVSGPVAALAEVLRPLDQDVRQLLHDATHQLRTPLTSIAGYLELLADGAAGPVTVDQARLLDAVARNTARLAALIDALEP